MSLTMTAILVSVLALSSTSIASAVQRSRSEATETMRLLCDKYGSSVNAYLNGVEQSEDMVSRYAISELKSVELLNGGVIGADGQSGAARRSVDLVRQEALDDYLHSYVERMTDVFSSVANRTAGVVTFYYRINPELSDKEQGFLYSRIGNASFCRMPLTKIENYDADDMEHTGWYYQPLRRGYPSWLEPYENKNLGMKMFSYVTPIYKAGTFIGVIGMDISYEMLIDQIRDIHIYDTGFAFLVKKDGTVVYHPQMESGANLAELRPELREDLERLETQGSNDEPIPYTVNGVAYQMFFSTLTSGLQLLVTAPVGEINKSGVELANRLTIIALVILLGFSTLTAVLMRRLTRPLQRLSEAAEQLADGNYEVRLDYAGDDEIGVLTKAFQRLVDHLRVYISDLNSKAYQDAMTGVRNKGAYGISQKKLDDAIRIGGTQTPPAFAIVMFDCNDLKKINDTYGHDRGDEYLRTACKLICDVFVHCPVFRMGGDEFAAILQAEAYPRRKELLDEFDQRAALINAKAKEPWEFVRIAHGMAAFEPETDRNAESVLRRADEQMYIHKKWTKQARQQQPRKMGPQWE